MCLLWLPGIVEEADKFLATYLEYVAALCQLNSLGLRRLRVAILFYGPCHAMVKAKWSVYHAFYVGNKVYVYCPSALPARRSPLEVCGGVGGEGSRRLQNSSRTSQ